MTIREQIIEANKAYRLGRPVMTDQAFDDLCEAYEKTVSPDSAKHGFQTFLTGGNAPYILNNVRSSRSENRQLRYEKHLVLIGLNTILVYNKK